MSRNFFVSLITSLTVGAIMLIYVFTQNKKIAVVDAVKLYNSFKMKEELERHNSISVKELKVKIDSLQNLLQLNSKQNQVSDEAVRRIYYEYKQAQESFEQLMSQLEIEINQQVWIRLNPLIDDYGKKESLRLIIGANGLGTVLYNDDYYDHTEQLIKYVNDIYESSN